MVAYDIPSHPWIFLTFLGIFFLSLIPIYNADIPDIVRVDIGLNSPQIPPTATRGMVIDAGSGGSRLHVYRWSPRIFDTVPPPLSFPTADERWTGRIAPAIQTYVDNLDGIEEHLAPLIDFAKSVLSGLENEYKNYPIYFKATGGMRELSQVDREKILNRVRIILSNKKICPFYFRNDFARVISGEEEAIYSWCATNLLMGSLLPSSLGQGTVITPNSTYGTLDLGGSSTQIAFFAPDQDILDGLFKLQIGSQKHWNVYAKSFLEFGINSARNRHLVGMADEYASLHPHEDVSVVPSTLSYCLHAGYSERVYDSSKKYLVEIAGPAVPASDQLYRCMYALKPLLFLGDSKSYCNTVYHGQCSIADSYQPPLPVGIHSHFIGTSSYTYPWKFLLLPNTASLDLVKQRAESLCQLNFGELLKYYEENNLNLLKEKISDQLPYFCFLASYTLVLLLDGYKFKHNDTLTVLDEVNGNKVAWALGAILYEINALPWGLREGGSELPWGLIFLSSCIGVIIGAVASFFIAKELFSEHFQSYSHDEHYLNGSRSNDSMTSFTSNQSLNIPGSFNSPSLHDKRWVLHIPQFNPFKSHDYHPIPSNGEIPLMTLNGTTTVRATLPISNSVPIDGESKSSAYQSNGNV